MSGRIGNLAGKDHYFCKCGFKCRCSKLWNEHFCEFKVKQKKENEQTN